MSNLNQCNFIGRVGSKPESRTMGNSGTTVASFSIAVSETWKDKQGQKQERTEWVRIEAFARLGEICCQYLDKGKLVFVQGKMQTDKWQDKEGKDRYTTKIVARDMQMLGSKGDSQSQPQQAAPVSSQSFDDDIPF